MGRPKPWLKAAVLVAASCAFVPAGRPASRNGGYLLVSGPAPLRFESLFKRLPAVVIPALPPPPRAPEAAPAEAPPTTLGKTNLTTQTVAVQPEKGTPPSPPLWPDASAEAPDRTPVTPESVLPYLTPQPPIPPGVKVRLPGFVPPAPPASAPVSTATYESR